MQPSSARACSATSWLARPNTIDAVTSPNTTRPEPRGPSVRKCSFQWAWAVFMTCLLMKLFSTSPTVAPRAWRRRCPAVKSSKYPAGPVSDDSAERSGIAVPLGHEVRPGELDHQLAALVAALGPPGHDPGARPAGRLPGFDHHRRRGQGVTRVHREMEPAVVDPEERASAFAQILDGETDHGAQHEHGVDHHVGVA